MAVYIGALVYDLGGVLITDGEAPALNAIKSIGISEEEGRKLFRENDRSFFTGQITEREWWGKFIDYAGNESAPEELARRFRENLKGYEKNLELARELKRSGKYRTAILTNNSEEWLEFQRNNFRLGECADVIISSHEAGAMKPDNQIYEYAMRQLGVGNHPIFFDDKTEYTKAAAGSGMIGVHVASPEDFPGLVRKLGISP